MFLLKERTHRMTIRYHPRIGHIYVPNQVARIPHERGGYIVHTNGQGFRSDIKFEKQQGTRSRILFFGDSMTAGDGCYNHETFPEKVGKILGAEVYNYGLSGSGTDQHLLIYEEFAKDVETDLIVICVYVDNIERNKAAYRPTIDRFSGRHLLVPKPYFTVNEKGELKLHHSPVPKERPDGNKGKDLKIHIENAPRDSLWALNKFKKFLDTTDKRTFLNRVVRIFLPQSADDHNIIRSYLLRLIWYQPYPDYKDLQSDGCRLMEAILKCFIDKTNGIPVLIVPIPSDHYYLDNIKSIYKSFFNRFNSYTQNTYVADITSALADLSLKERKKVRFSRDIHFSPFGHRKVAELIAGKIKSLNLIPKQPTRLKS